ncbi:hypothetical protein QMK19_19775 [Streptomyces sp. H10-C2]|uniref:hypothetical protein n=1 Tax=unclassified Streptomyces TaxID=2593676 RepID=UPI0024BB4FA2|nr:MULTISPECIES: hypothetical protein [unclassified Streptomyces]MDJ0345488.1 hypothetical protein [Streptomyces sp. PH10-H1]MDJ0371854.1 hypothetical protein [Streptomyces sp. H10-C2]
MRASAFVYPWDVVGDPDAPRRIADLGVQQVTLASAYHSTRALTPRHPRQRIVTARHAAVLYPPDPRRWSGRSLRPYPQAWVPATDAYGEAAAALSAAGLSVHSWVVLAHNSRLGEEFPRTSVRNAYGDRYSWAPCIAQPEVRAYAADLAVEAAVRPGTDGTELESCGWYGLAHLHGHDKIGGVPLGGAAQYLMSLCFCRTCRDGYAGLGQDADALQSAVKAALVPVWSGEREPGPTDRAAEWAEVEKLLGADLAGATLSWRAMVARHFQREIVAAVRAGAGPGFQILLHADPGPHRTGANVGVDAEDVLAHADGLVLPCAGGTAERAAVLSPFAPHLRPDTVLAANFSVVTGMGGSPRTLAADLAHAAALGATEARLYHAGLASDADLRAVRSALEALRSTPDL